MSQSDTATKGEALRTDVLHSPDTIAKVMSVLIQQPLLQSRTEKLLLLYEVLNSDSEVKLVFDLLHRSLCVDSLQAEKAAIELAEHITSKWALSPQDTCFVAQDVDGSTSTADVALEILKTKLGEASGGWKKGNFLDELSKAATDPRWKNVVLVDDFIGTGNKLAGKVTWIREAEGTQPPRKLFVVCFVGHQRSEDVVEPLVTGYRKAITLRRGISDHYTVDEVDSEIQRMKEIEQRFGSISAKESLGYEQTESLYFPMFLNTPNNVFPVFWRKKHKLHKRFAPILSRVTK